MCPQNLNSYIIGGKIFEIFPPHSRLKIQGEQGPAQGNAESNTVFAGQFHQVKQTAYSTSHLVAEIRK
ncbi:unnamed protein product [Ranitomeya imitator]|uniref:Uncharacterized protein n=1 Tax=Ranitomeya imitator TaxID=111125 RepID=A0ABN9MAD3_9NEOB|nr:unnamed protein product [Ranitomeya imitator]